jgi:hypothetical protein
MTLLTVDSGSEDSGLVEYDPGTRESSRRHWAGIG